MFVVKEQLPIPMMPMYAATPMIDPGLVVRAVFVKQVADLDMDLWNQVIEEKGVEPE